MADDGFAELQKLKHRLEALGVKIKRGVGEPSAFSTSEVRFSASNEKCPHLFTIDSKLYQMYQELVMALTVMLHYNVLADAP